MLTPLLGANSAKPVQQMKNIRRQVDAWLGNVAENSKGLLLFVGLLLLFCLGMLFLSQRDPAPAPDTARHASQPALADAVNV